MLAFDLVKKLGRHLVSLVQETIHALIVEGLDGALDILVLVALSATGGKQDGAGESGGRHERAPPVHR